MHEELTRTTEEDENIVTMIQVYYMKRGMEMPDAEEALAFFLSEVGELCEAYRTKNYEDGISSGFHEILIAFEQLGMKADEWVSVRGQWIRNGDRHKTPSVADEIADLMMMLYVFAFKSKISPFFALIDKMKRKLAKVENIRN